MENMTKQVAIVDGVHNRRLQVTLDHKHVVPASLTNMRFISSVNPRASCDTFNRSAVRRDISTQSFHSDGWKSVLLSPVEMANHQPNLITVGAWYFLSPTNNLPEASSIPRTPPPIRAPPRCELLRSTSRIAPSAPSIRP